MKTYLVGGAVRDKLLGQQTEDRDWVVVGGKIADLINQGFKQVGRDFPVFLHPKTKEEYALARTEKKIAKGHQGFSWDISNTISLEQDLFRRDLTINAMAETTDGTLIDPYHGQRDLQNKTLRHVSAAFAEDPLRILRVARFYARFDDFQIAKETLELMGEMIARDEIHELTPERIYTETSKALATRSPHRYFQLLDELGAAKTLWPELTQAGIQRLKSIQKESVAQPFLFAALCFGINQFDIKKMACRLRLPKQLIELAVITAKAYSIWETLDHLRSVEILDWLTMLDAFRKPGRFVDLCQLWILIASTLGQKKPERDPHRLLVASLMPDVSGLAQNLSSKAIGEALYARRSKAIADYLQAK